MKLVFVSSGKSGAGRFAVGCSLGTALRRAGVACDYTMVAAHEFTHFGEVLGFTVVSIPFDHERELDSSAARESELYRTLVDLDPDIIVLQQAWYSLHHVV
ncbi:MAG: hypothetical protein EA384_12560, partial [Spirochaetaceae bacterium]